LVCFIGKQMIENNYVNPLTCQIQMMMVIVLSAAVNRIIANDSQ